MKRIKNLYTAAALAGLMVLIFDGRRALLGAQAGLSLCIQTVIPSLFPFFVISGLLTEALQETGLPWLRRLARMLGIPDAAAQVLIPAFLGGYPVGAKTVGDLYQSRRITRYDGERLLAFCSNAGPSFLFGMVSAFFPDPKMPWLLWCIHISGAVLSAFLFPATPAQWEQSADIEADSSKGDFMLSALKAMALVCGWVVVFRTVIVFLEAWVLWAFPQWLQVVIMGALELSNGCCALMRLPDVRVRFVVCSCMLSLGGLCVLLQTMSVVKGLSLRSYVLGKVLQTSFSLILSCAVVAKKGWLLPMLIPVILLLLRKKKNRYGNPDFYPV